MKVSFERVALLSVCALVSFVDVVLPLGAVDREAFSLSLTAFAWSSGVTKKDFSSVGSVVKELVSYGIQ